MIEIINILYFIVTMIFIVVIIKTISTLLFNKEKKTSYESFMLNVKKYEEMKEDAKNK